MKIRRFALGKTLKNISNVFIKPYFEYATLARGGAHKTHLLKTDKQIIHTMISKNKFESVKPLYK